MFPSYLLSITSSAHASASLEDFRSSFILERSCCAACHCSYEMFIKSKKILDMWQGPFGIIATLLLSDPVQWLQPFSHGTSVCTAASARWLRSLFTWFRSTFGLSFWLEPIARNHLGESFTAFAAPLQSCGRSNFFLPITLH